MDTTAPTKSQAGDAFAPRLLKWYAAHARSMPWRVSHSDHASGVRPDPYQVWLSEIMLQQTQVATVRDYFLKFIGKWPDVKALANADLEDVLKAWAGLGYYSRARNLKKCADKIVSDRGGRFPGNRAELLGLPGIGDYTASAIAAIAFDEPVPVLDGNVERVISRHSRIETPFPAAKIEAREQVEDLLDTEKPGEFAQAMMDLGATICTPKRPACALCPVNRDCAGYRAGDAETYPRKAPKQEKKSQRGAAFVIRNSTGSVFLNKRSERGLLGGMSQVPTTNWTASTSGQTGRTAVPFEGDWRLLGKARHTFTHFHLELEVWGTTVEEAPLNEGWWSSQSELPGEALPTVMRKVLAVAGLKA